MVEMKFMKKDCEKSKIHKLTPNQRKIKFSKYKLRLKAVR